jgi:succinoglycan biosynthesis protein ExoA
MAPVVALGLCLAGILLLPFLPALSLLAFTYPLGCVGWGVVQAITRRDPWMLAAGPALVTMHLSWAVGFLRSVAGGGKPAVGMAIPAPVAAAVAAPVRQEETAG